jgi:predicted metal-dependent phosphotriesterase family hydrolase
MGYDHVLRRIVPRSKESFGLADELIDKLIVTNPRRMLTRDSGPGMTGERRETGYQRGA